LKSEKIELLKNVAEVAPKEMGARFFQYYDYVRRAKEPAVEFYDPDSDEIVCCFGYNDQRNGGGIIAMLDAMEKAGYMPSLTQTAAESDDERYEVEYAAFDDPCPTCSHRSWEYTRHPGKTRAEAVAKAFVAVFGKQPEITSDGGEL